MTTQAILFSPQARRAQSDFREALECLARPGRIGSLGDAAFPLREARRAYSLLLALADQEVSIAVSGGDEPLARFASLGAGSKLVSEAEAGYVLSIEDPGGALLNLRRGTLETPEDGATVIQLVESLAGGRSLRIAGPGVDGSAVVTVSGLSAEALAARNEACAAYPLGIDLFLVDHEGRLLGLPRTSSLAWEAP